jgi:aldose 1-epimerase
MHLYRITNKHGLEASVTDIGATLVTLKTPDRKGNFADIVLGFDNVSEYEHGKGYLGSTIGRFGNRIAEGKFCLNGQTYHLTTNNGANHLHGGNRGFSKVVWQARQLSEQSVEFTYTSPDGEEGYPGTLEVKVTYSLNDADELRIDYAAQAAPGKDTVINLTNHTYFNLTADPQKTILEHELKLFASRFTPVGAGLIPTGELRPVAGTPLDFTTTSMVGTRIEQGDEQLKLAKGYDHNFVIDDYKPGTLAHAAIVYEPTSGRVIEVDTTEPGIQFYSGNFLDGSIKGKGGQTYGHRSGLCLETQHFPDSPNHPEFPTSVLKAGTQYESATVFRFSTR